MCDTERMKTVVGICCEHRDGCKSKETIVVLPRFNDESSVREGVLKFTLVANNDTTLHGVHTETQLPSVLLS